MRKLGGLLWYLMRSQTRDEMTQKAELQRGALASTHDKCQRSSNIPGDVRCDAYLMTAITRRRFSTDNLMANLK